MVCSVTRLIQCGVVASFLAVANLAAAQSADSDLRTAYLEVYTQVTVALVAKSVATECNRAGTRGYAQALDSWERQHKVGSAFRGYATKVLTPTELKATQMQERDEIMPKVKKAFVPCPTPERFEQMLASRDFNLTERKPSSMQRVHQAMQKDGVDPAPAQASLPVNSPRAAGAIESILASQAVQIGVNGTMSSEIDLVVVFTDNTVTNDLNRVFANGPRKPSQWGRFLREADLLKVTWESGSTETLKPANMMRMQPAPTAMTLNGQYRALEPDGGTSDKNGIEFFADGRYLTGTAGSTKQASGTYQLNGFTIEFKPQSGPTEKQLFYIVPAAHKGVLGQIGVAGLRMVQRN